MSVKSFFEKRRRKKEYSKYINLRYKEWKENKPSEEEALLENVSLYKTAIKQSLDNSKNEEVVEKLQILLEMNCQTNDDLTVLNYLYNDGALQSREEFERVLNYRYAVKNNLLVDYDEERKKRNVYAAVIPFLITFLAIIFGAKGFREHINGIVLALIASLVVALISMIVGHSTNIEKAKEYGIPDNDPSVTIEKLRRDLGVTSGIVSGITIGKHTKNAVKDIMNVDSWKELK